MCDSLTTIDELPNEILLVIFSYCNVDSLNNSSLVCKRWNVVIGQSDILWKELCSSLHETRRLIQTDRELGRSWQESFKMNYNTNETKKKWKKGEFSNPKNYQALPTKLVCKMDDESWGEIFQMELDRC
ncbi:F-box only protein 48-like [Mytilus trossulus]|uniref:F-box only protein 48-like n=1 Tax=Mytilus trossulus TaxID=6551 RepID=UPI0030043394